MSGTLIVAIVAVAMSSFSLAWQLAQFVLTGARVTVELLVGASDGATAVHQPAGKPFSWPLVAKQGFTAPIVGATIRNRGRMPVSITAWRFGFESGPSVAPVRLGPLNHDKELPHRLDAGASETWLMDAADIGRAASAWRAMGKETGRLYAAVDLGTGKTVRSKNRESVS